MPSPRRGRRIVRLLIAVSLVLLLAYVGAAFYFATMIRNDALAVERFESPRNLEVSEIAGTRITLTEREVDPFGNLNDPGTWGLEYDDGYAVLTGEPDIEGKSTTREFEVVSGEAPETGDLAGTDLYAFPSTPLAPGRAVTYESDLGEMPAWQIEGTVDTWVIGVHGRGGPIEEMSRLLETTTRLGMPGLSIGYRNDDGAPGDPSGQYAFGATEWRDLAAAVEYAQGQGAEDVVLAGSSMGGAIVASYLRHTPDAPVVGVILDSPALDFGEVIEYGAAQLELPVPVGVLTPAAKAIAGWRFDVDWDATDYLTDDGWVRVPTLVFHGDVDDTVPVAISERLASGNDLVDLEVLEGVDHVRAWNADPAAFDARVTNYLADLGIE